MGVVLWQKWFLIHKISLQLRILNVKHFIVEFFKVGIRHLVRVHSQVVSQHDFQLFRAYVSAAVFDLTTVGIYVFRFFTVLMAEFTENLRHFITFILSHKIFSFLGLVPFDRNLSLGLASLRVQAFVVFCVFRGRSFCVACEELNLRKGPEAKRMKSLV